MKMDILDFHQDFNDFFENENREVRDIDKAFCAFEAVRPDGVDFDAEGRVCVFLEFTRPTDAANDSPRKWVERKDSQKSDKYERHRNFIEYKSRKQGMNWTCQQANFSVGVRGSVRTSDDRLKKLGLESKKDP